MAVVMSMGSAFPEMEGRSEYDSKRRSELFRMAVDAGYVKSDERMPPKDTLIRIMTDKVVVVDKPVEATEAENPDHLEEFKELKNPQLWSWMKEHGVPFHKTEKREELLSKIAGHLNGL